MASGRRVGEKFDVLANETLKQTDDCFAGKQTNEQGSMTDTRKNCLCDEGRGGIVGLADRIEQALRMADDLGLALVSIDLCSAMERLKDLGAAPNSIESRDHE
jgi:hypothetical protein